MLIRILHVFTVICLGTIPFILLHWWWTMRKYRLEEEEEERRRAYFDMMTLYERHVVQKESGSQVFDKAVQALARKIDRSVLLEIWKPLFTKQFVRGW